MKRMVMMAVAIVAVVMMAGCGGSGGNENAIKAEEVGQKADGSIPWIKLDKVLQGPMIIPFKSAESGGGNITITATKVSDSEISLILAADRPVTGMGVTVWLEKGNATFVSASDQSWVLVARESEAAWQVAKGRLIDGENAKSTLFGVVFLGGATYRQIGKLQVKEISLSDMIAFDFVNK